MGLTEYLCGAEHWKGLQSIGLVESERRVNHQTTVEQRYYLLSIKSDAQRFATAVRSHWSIENQLHWVLDVSFQEELVFSRPQRPQCMFHSSFTVVDMSIAR